jgi:uncharacterized protein YoaH (UPF0181 family)
METYSAQMQAAVRHEVQQASIEQLRELLAYFRQRGGPGRGIVAQEITERRQRRQVNYPPHDAHPYGFDTPEEAQAHGLLMQAEFQAPQPAAAAQ